MYRIYLAASYERREELRGYRTALTTGGYEVTSRWLDIEDPSIEGEAATGNPIRYRRQRYALIGVEDVRRADIVIVFTEPGPSRGGHLVELGMAIALEKRIYVAGPRSNLFCWLPECVPFPDPQGLITNLLESPR